MLGYWISGLLDSWVLDRCAYGPPGLVVDARLLDYMLLETLLDQSDFGGWLSALVFV